jgi:hypothetical protein
VGRAVGEPREGPARGPLSSVAGRTAAIAAALAVAGGAARAQPPPVFPTGAQLVTIDVVVVDRDGRPVRGLTREDFQVNDGGAPQAITHFEAVSAAAPDAAPPTLAPRSFVIVYDDLHIAPLGPPSTTSSSARRDRGSGSRSSSRAPGRGGRPASRRAATTSAPSSRASPPGPPGAPVAPTT